jgi:hypothetical protein
MSVFNPAAPMNASNSVPMLAFPTIDPDESRVLVFDFSPALQSGEVLSGGPVLKSVVCTAGTDPNPLGILNGKIAYDTTGTLILQPVSNMSSLNGNDYAFEVSSATTLPNKIVVIRALLQIRA